MDDRYDICFPCNLVASFLLQSETLRFIRTTINVMNVRFSTLQGKSKLVLEIDSSRIGESGKIEYLLLIKIIIVIILN